ncbi:MAG: hypothetical protein NZM65_09595 [Flavobacteriales bacterium]|nr:hypothetical protein [Flavobacteriales bacterium]MDW8410923.1 hypothetical protein [Flavobacteriales bacterium]
MGHLIWWIALSLCLVSEVIAQVNIMDTQVKAVVFAPAGSFHLPLGMLYRRTGLFYGIGGSLFFKNSRNMYWEVEGSLFTGNRIREQDALSRIATHDGYIIAQDGGFADVRVLFRGWQGLAALGKRIIKLGPTPHCGIYLKGGLGWLGHKIRVEVQHNNVPALQGDYLKGYDRLRGGLSLTQEVGYIYFSRNKRITFRTGLQCSQAFARSLRGINYDTGLLESPTYLDVFLAIKLAWMIVAYIRPAEVYYTR